MSKQFKVIRNRRSYDIVDTTRRNTLVEGGFFSESAAMEMALWWTKNAAEWNARFSEGN